MSEVPPSEPTRRHRPDASMRREVLRPEGRPVAPKPLSAALAQIPDIERDSVPSAPALDRNVAVLAPEAQVPWAAESPFPPVEVAIAAPGPAAGAAAPGGSTRRRVPAPRPPRRWYRTAVFGLAVVALLAAIPALGWEGYHLVRDSKAGTFRNNVSNPSAPNYQSTVEPTPTAIIIQRGGFGQPIALTVLALGSEQEGGSVLFVPLDTRVAHPGYGIDRLRAAYLLADPKVATGNLVDRTAEMLHIGFDQSNVINVNDAGWAALTAKSAPISFQNPDTVTVNGKVLPAGPVSLTPDMVGPYLSALRPNESDLNRLNRHRVFWDAWLANLKASTDPAVIPGETTSGIGLFARTLSKGPNQINTLPITPDPAAPNGPFTPDENELRRLMAEMVPAPIPAYPGALIATRLLNGVSGRPLGLEVTRPLVLAGASISVIGNAPTFGNATTIYEYRDPYFENRAKFLKAALGNKGMLRLNRLAPDTIDVTVIIGRDVLDQLAPAGVGTPTSKGAGG